jgi:cytochrome c oxidase subunit 1
MPQHFLGFLGMPRRIYTYQADRGWDELNLISTIGVLFQAAGILFFVYNLIYSWLRGRKAGDDPWDAWTLEWATTSPPADYNFAKTPIVKSRRPLWDAKHPDDPDWAHE